MQRCLANDQIGGRVPTGSCSCRLRWPCSRCCQAATQAAAVACKPARPSLWAAARRQTAVSISLATMTGTLPLFVVWGCEWLSGELVGRGAGWGRLAGQKGLHGGSVGARQPFAPLASCCRWLLFLLATPYTHPCVSSFPRLLTFHLRVRPATACACGGAHPT